MQKHQQVKISTRMWANT